MPQASLNNADHSPEALSAEFSTYKHRTHGVFEMYFGEKKTNRKVPDFLDYMHVDTLKPIYEAIPYTRRFISDILCVGPLLFYAFCATECLRYLTPTIMLVYTNKLLQSIESAILTNEVKTRAITSALICRVAVQFSADAIGRVSYRVQRVLENRVTVQFQARYVKAMATLDYNVDEDSERARKLLSEMDTWEMFMGLTRATQVMCAVCGHIWFIVHMTNWNLSTLLLLVVSILSIVPLTGTWAGRGFISRIYNPFYLRMESLKAMAMDPRYKQEMVAGNLGEYIADAYIAAMKSLGDTDVNRDVWDAWRERPSLPGLWIRTLVGDWSKLLFAFSALYGYPLQFSLLSTIQSTARSMSWELLCLFGAGSEGSLASTVFRIKSMYELLDARPRTSEKALGYPDILTSPSGMSIELRNVGFSYPTGDEIKPALRNISCVIQPGQLVVVVGTNGSGKTSLVKLLTGLHNPTSGEILVDGRPIDEYAPVDLRQSMAVLLQEHSILPLSISENIGLGWPERAHDQAAVEEAAKLSGAHAFITKTSLEGYSKIINPVRTKFICNLAEAHPLHELFKSWERCSDVSGGERQRLAAARTFMRMRQGGVNLVVVDEPSSAMDPAGEYELFKNLREGREGKTMIFITHRFGHLTKRADLILCMKDGQLVESGTHSELIARKGTYHDLYDLQAQAFSD